MQCWGKMSPELSPAGPTWKAESGPAKVADYSVKGGYRCIRDSMLQAAHPCQRRAVEWGSEGLSDEELGSYLDKVMRHKEIEHHDRVLLWQIATGTVACGKFAVRRCLDTDHRCYICGAEETIEHLFVGCDVPNAVWRRVEQLYARYDNGLRPRHPLVWGTVFKQLGPLILQAPERKPQVQVLVQLHVKALQAIWKTRERNKNKTIHSSAEVIQEALAMLSHLVAQRIFLDHALAKASGDISRFPNGWGWGEIFVEPNPGSVTGLDIKF